jgi:hypothetical protein
MNRGRLASLVILLVAGCTTVRGRADEAYAKGDYLVAADLYDKAVASDPKDQRALTGRSKARIGVVGVLIGRAQATRRGGHDEAALTELEQALERRDSWAMLLDPTLAAQVAGEVKAASAFITAAIDLRSTTMGPLSAEVFAHRYDHLLAHADFAPARADLVARLRKDGATICARLDGEGGTPYWRWLLARYCGHWGQARDLPVLPNLRSKLVVEGVVAGETEAQTEDLRVRLADAFKASVWFAANARVTAHASFDGRVATSFESHPVALSANYTEQVPYTDYETQQESYQEPYNDTETYTEQVPHTEYQSQTHSCGDSTCTDSVPVTVYSSETRTRTVTKYRTAYRSVTKPVTRYRDVARVFSYQGIERSGSYASTLRVRVDRDVPVTAAAVNTPGHTVHGVDHDVTFTPAGVFPQHVDVPTPDEFAASEHDRLARELFAQLQARYAQVYCGAASYTLEEASACAYLDAAHAPAPARAELHARFGADEEVLGSLLGQQR